MIIFLAVAIFIYLFFVPKGFFFRTAKDAKAVNISGSLRMLTQRAMKARLMVLADLSKDSAQQELEASMALFDSRLEWLKGYCKGPELEYLHDRVYQNWKIHKQKLESYPGASGMLTLLRENNDLMDICDDLVTAIQDRANRKLASLVNLSGRQRMLSQRIAKNCVAIYMGIDTEKRRDELSRSVVLFNIAVKKLKSETRYRPIIALQLEQAASRWDTSGIPKKVNRFQKGGEKDEIVKVLIENMNEITSLYDDILMRY